VSYQPKIDLKGYNQKVKQLALLVPRETKAIILAEGRRLVEDLVKRTRPGGIKNAGSKAQMTKKIWGNVLATAVLPRPAGGNISKAQAKEDIRKAKDYVRIDRFYDAWRRGKKIPTVQKNKVLKARAKKFVENQLSHRGFMAAGWLGGSNPLGATKGLTNEIKRHRPHGKFEKIDTLTRFRITITNLVNYAQKNPTVHRILRAAIAGRQKEIGKNIARILKGGKFSVLRKK